MIDMGKSSPLIPEVCACCPAFINPYSVADTCGQSKPNACFYYYTVVDAPLTDRLAEDDPADVGPTANAAPPDIAHSQDVSLVQQRP